MKGMRINVKTRVKYSKEQKCLIKCLLIYLLLSSDIDITALEATPFFPNQAFSVHISTVQK